VALLVAVALAAGSVVAGGSGTTPARKVRAVVPPGTVLSWTSAGALVSSTAAGSGVVALPQRNGTGLVPAGDGHLLATGSGVELAGPSLVPTGASVPFDGEAGGWRAVGFADRGAALAATQTAPDGSDQAEVVTFSGQPPVELGEAEEVAADPAAPGIYAVLAGGTDGTSVERRDAGQRAVGVATAAGLLVDLHEVSASNEASALHALAARSVVVSVLPDPTGRRVALTIAGVGAAGLAGIVVVDRAGGLVGSVRLSGGFAGAPAWSPDGTSLVYATTATLRRGSRTAVTVWRPGERPSTDVLPASVSEALGDCIWAGSTSVVCADAVSAGPIRTWVYGSPGGPFTVVSGPGVPFAWLAAAPSVPVTPRLWPREPVLAPQPATASTVTPFQKATWSRISLAASLGSG
jgi:hypothetical protein